MTNSVVVPYHDPNEASDTVGSSTRSCTQTSLPPLEKKRTDALTHTLTDKHELMLYWLSPALAVKIACCMACHNEQQSAVFQHMIFTG